MAIEVIDAAYLSINGTQYQDHCKNISLELEVEEVEKTNFSSGGYREVLGGIKSGTLSGDIMDDLADNDVNEDFFAMWGTVVACAVRADAGAISTSNPEYQFNVLVKTVKAFSAGVGEIPDQSFSWPVTGSITRDVTP